ncbi:hypothetical protein SDC9_133959 [bioreactor metagenome]|uniref:LysM domain-containing protein n=1 Tax=bioreactor metagenome TaxID=1076179 RepID=A0A645DCC8_9ZZZZ
MGEVAAALPPSSECTPVVRGDIAPPPDQTPAQQVPAIPPTAGVPMPPPPKPQALPEKTEIYTVQSGDTLLKIARSHQTSLEILMGLNGLPREQADHLKIGQKIKVPALTTNRDNEKTSTVVAGLVAPPAEK